MSAMAIDSYPYAARIQPDLTVTFAIDGVKRHAPWIKPEHAGMWAEINGQFGDVRIIDLSNGDEGPVWPEGVAPYAPQGDLWELCSKIGALGNQAVAA